MTDPWAEFAKPTKAADPWAEFAPAAKPVEQAAQPTQAAPRESAPDMWQAKLLRDAGAGLLRGAGSIGNTIYSGLESLDNATKRMGGFTVEDGRSFGERYKERADRLDENARSLLGADTDSIAYAGGKLGGEIAGTAGVGTAIAAPLRAFGALRASPVAQRVAQSLRTGGLSLGGAQGVSTAANIGTRALGGAATGGASAGLVNPEDAGTGAALGGVLPGIVKGAGAIGQAARSAVSPKVKNPQLAQKAIDAGIPLGIGDIAQGPAIRATRSILNEAPFTSGQGFSQTQAVQEGYNRAVGRTFGEEATSLTPEVLAKAKSRMGAEFDRLWNRNTLKVDVDFAQQLDALQQEAAKLPQGEGARVMSWLEDIASKVKQTEAGDYVIPGDVANRLQSKLGRDVDKAQGFLKSALQDMRGGMLGAFNRGVSPEDAAALTQARGQYKAFKTVQPLMRKSEAGVAGRDMGDVPAALLPGAVVEQYGDRIASSPFADLSQIGSQYVADRVARTGGSVRAGLQNTATALGLMYLNPASLAAIPTAMGVQSALGSPALASKAIKRQLAKRPRLNDEAGTIARLTQMGVPVLAAQ